MKKIISALLMILTSNAFGAGVVPNGTITSAKLAPASTSGLATLNNVGFKAVVSSNTLVLTLTQADGSSAPTAVLPAVIGFRNPTVTNPGVSPVSFTSTLASTVTATCGMQSGSGANTWWVYALADTTNDVCIAGTPVSESGLASPTAISGCTTSPTTLYCNSAHTSRPIKLLGSVGATWSNPNWSSVTSVTTYRSGIVNTNQISNTAISPAKLGSITDGSTLDQSGSGSTLEIKSLGVGTGQIANNAVTTAKLSTSAIPGQSSVVKAPTVTVYASAGSGTYTTPTNPSPLWLEFLIVGGGGGGGGSGQAGIEGSSDGGESFVSGVGQGDGGGGLTIGTDVTGGVGGNGSVSAGTGYATYGADGGTSSIIIDTNTMGLGGATGGSSIVGGGGRGGSPTAGGYGAGNGGGGGGGGILGSNSYSAFGGPGGGAGGYCRTIITSGIASSYSYTVGAGGTGAVAGTNGHNGGDGADGLIQITAYYQ